MKFLEVAAVLMSPIFAAQVSFDPASKSTESEKTYGKIEGDDTYKDFNCPGDSYVNKIDGYLTDQVNALSFHCSDAAQTRSECQGAYCGTNVPASAVGVYGAKNVPVLKSISAQSGFSNMLINADGDYVTAIVSNVAGTDQQLIPDNDNKGGDWSKSVFPSDKDKSIGTNGLRITGYGIWTDKSGVTALRPHFRILNGKAEEVANQPIKAMPAFTGFNDNFSEKLSSQQYGKNGGNDFEFHCPPANYITAISGVVDNNMRNVVFECNDGTKSDCRGGECGSDPGGQTPGKYVTKDKKGWSRMVSATGFGSMEFYSNGRVSGIRSINAVGNVLSDQPETSNDWQVWPTTEDNKETGVIITGFKYRTGKAVDMLQPYFKVLKPAGSNSVAPVSSTSAPVSSTKAPVSSTVEPGYASSTPASKSAEQGYGSTSAVASTPASTSASVTASVSGNYGSASASPAASSTPCDSHTVVPTSAPTGSPAEATTTPCETDTAVPTTESAYQAPSPAPASQTESEAPSSETPCTTDASEPTNTEEPSKDNEETPKETKDYGATPSPSPAHGNGDSYGAPTKSSYGGLEVTPAPSKDDDLPYCDEEEKADYGSSPSASAATGDNSTASANASSSSTEAQAVPEAPQLGQSASGAGKIAGSLLSVVVAALLM